MPQILIVLFLVISSVCLGEEFFSSGLLKSLNDKTPDHKSERVAVGDFIKNYYGTLGENTHWVSKKRTVDSTHVHSIFDLMYRGRRVMNAFLRIHFNRQGWIEYAESNFSEKLTLTVSNTRFDAKHWVQDYLKERPEGLGVRQESVIWINPKTKEPIAAVEILFKEKGKMPRKVVIDEKTGRLLDEIKMFRTASGAVYMKSPYGGATPTTVTLDGLTNSTQLLSSNLWVRREQPDESTVDVTPGIFTPDLDPASYTPECQNSSGTACVNQGFDAVNVYYHLNRYRSRVTGFLADLGATVSFSYDPLNVLINPLSLTDTANNAMYVAHCREDGSMERCLVFLRPDALTRAQALANCGKSSSQIYDLAREAVVVAHEYQHYVTDTITSIPFGSSGSISVGDALHEGYSDYLAASYVSEANGTDVTLVGEYALQDCTPLQRQLNTIRPLQNDSSDEDPHASGLSWASGLWKLRTEMGVEKTDPLVVKSLFFLSTDPGALEAVEALVKADKALYSGDHVNRIREVFYQEVKFVGGNSNLFLDPVGRIADVGIKGCGAVPAVFSKYSFGGTVVALLGWLLTLLMLARKTTTKFAALFFICLASNSPAASFTRVCKVHESSSRKSPVNCTSRPGSEIINARPGANGFVYIESGNCKGYAFLACLSGLTRKVQPNQRAPASLLPGESREKIFKLSVNGHFDGSLGKPVEGEGSKGLGYGVGATLWIPLTDRFSLGAGPFYQFLRLGRALGGGGTLLDPNTTDFEQSIKVIGFRASGLFALSDRQERISEPEWLLEVGGEFWYPLSAIQTDSAGETISFNTGKFLVAYAGPAVDVNLFSSVSLSASLQGFYNLHSAPNFMGVRFLTAIQCVL